VKDDYYTWVSKNMWKRHWQNSDPEYQERLRKGQEALDQAKAAKAPIMPIHNLPRETDDSLSRHMDDIHNDYLKSSEQTRQQSNDLHARNLRMMDIKIKRAATLGLNKPKNKPGRKTSDVNAKILELLKRDSDLTTLAIARELDKAKLEPSNKYHKRLWMDAYHDCRTRASLEQRVSRLRGHLRTC
jgi:hypothetical protein